MQRMWNGPERHFHVAKHAGGPPELIDLLTDGGIQLINEVHIRVCDMKLVGIDPHDRAFVADTMSVSHTIPGGKQLNRIFHAFSLFRTRKSRV